MLNAHKISLIAVLTALAIVLSIAESLIPSVGIPGVKIGLANILILITLYELGIKEAIFVNLCRVVLANILRGTILSMGFLMSFAGAFLSLTIMIIFYLFIKKFSIIGVSVVGSIFHVFGQIIVAMFFMGTIYVLYYLPIIAISAIITGVLVGFVSRIIIKSGTIKKLREKHGF